MRTIVGQTLRIITEPVHKRVPSIRVLMYHRVNRSSRYDQLTVSPGRFAAQIGTLAHDHRLVSLSTAIDMLRQPGPLTPAVVLTFDDGYRDCLQYAVPILEQFSAPATFFVTTGFCDQHSRHPRYPNESGRLHMDWGEVSALASHPLFDIGSHTATHPFLSRLPVASLRQEIVESKQIIEDQIGCPVEHFCYPSGDYDQRERDFVEYAGYRAAVTVAPGVNRRGVDLLQLKRTEMTDRDCAQDTQTKLAGGFDVVHALLNWRRERAFRRKRYIARMPNQSS